MASLRSLGLILAASLLAAPKCGGSDQVLVLFPAGDCGTGRVQPQVWNRGIWEPVVPSLDADTCLAMERLWTLVVRSCCIGPDGKVREDLCSTHGTASNPAARCP